jgi:hypothetical protein
MADPIKTISRRLWVGLAKGLGDYRLVRRSHCNLVRSSLRRKDASIVRDTVAAMKEVPHAN